MSRTNRCSADALSAPAAGSLEVHAEKKVAWYRRFLAAARAIYIRDRERRELLTLDDRMLADIGLTRADALREAEKPFWRE